MPNTLKNIVFEEMKKRNITQKDVETKTNGRVKQGNLSASLKGTRHFTLNTLDELTSVLDLPSGHFYPFYISECKDVVGNRLRSKCRDFIIKCNEIECSHLADDLVNEMVQEGQSNTEVFLGIADELVSKNMECAAVRFYDIVIELETDKLSERLANTLYKRYCIVRNWNMDHAYDSAIQLSSYLSNITTDKLEAYRKVVACYFVLEKWEKVVQLSEEMASQAICQKDKVQYGNAQLYKLRAKYYLKEYSEAIEIAEEVIALLGEERSEFKIWGEGNRFNSMIASGKVEVIEEFVCWLDRNQSEVAPYIHCILDVCIRHGMIEKADNLIEKYHLEMQKFERNVGDNPFKKRLFARFQLMYSRVLFAKKQQQREAIDLSLKAMEIYADLGLPAYILNCVKDFHLHKDFCTDEQNRLFNSLLDLAITKTS